MPVNKWIEKFKWVMKIGFIPQILPGVARGWLNEFLAEAKQLDPVTGQPKISIPVIFSMVAENQSLWDMIDPRFITEVRGLLHGVGGLDWFTVDWAIEAIKVKHSDIASIFLGDPDARAWFQNQLDIFRENLMVAV
jgi:hypothetical protein